MPVTTPVVVFTVAFVVALLLHVPPPVALASVVVEPMHTDGVPVFTEGAAFTVTNVVRSQPSAVV